MALDLTAEEQAEFARLLDTRESDTEEALGLKLIESARERVRLLAARVDAMTTPDLDSRLQAVDNYTPYDPFSHQLRSFAAIAIDNLNTIFEFIDKTGAVPMSAHYSMIRSVIEATSTGIWMLAAGKIYKQAFMSLRLTYGNREMVVALGKSLPVRSADTDDKVRTRLLELHANLRDGYSQKKLDEAPSIVDSLIATDRVLKSKRFFFESNFVWRACSGIAHANHAILPLILESIPVEIQGRQATALLRSRLTFTGGFLITAVENLERLLDMYDVASAPDAGLRNTRLMKEKHSKN